jgi:putative transcriptional regulator
MFDEDSGKALTDLPSAPFAQDGLFKLMRRIEGLDPRDETSRAPRMVEGVELPEGVVAAGLHNRRWIAPGYWAAHIKIPREGNWRLFLLRAPANAVIPSHSHYGEEFVSVLSGAFDDGEVFVAGEFATSRADRSHSLRVGSDGACICLVAIDGPIAWRGLSWAVRPILGI